MQKWDPFTLECVKRHENAIQREHCLKNLFIRLKYMNVNESEICKFQQLIDDKKTLSEKCEALVKELKVVDKKYQDKIKSVTERFVVVQNFSHMNQELNGEESKLQ